MFKNLFADKTRWTVGYDHDFVDPSSGDYGCPLCLHVMRTPTLTDCCGGHFCHGCIAAIIESGKACPLCRQRKFRTLVNKAVERKILGLHVACTMRDQGCSWSGELRDLNGHLRRDAVGDCQLVVVECPERCGAQVRRGLVSVHLRDTCPRREVVCPHCSHRGRLDTMASLHARACPNGCGAFIESCRLLDHRAECPLETVSCDFKELGCEDRIRRQDSFEHNTRKHMVVLQTLMMSMKKRLEASEGVIRSLEEAVSAQGVAHEVAVKELVEQRDASLRDNDAARLHRCVTESLTFTSVGESSLSQPTDDHCPCVHDIAIDDIASRRDRKERWRSEYYTLPGGYMLRLEVFPGGRAKGADTHVSIAIGVTADKHAYRDVPARFRIEIDPSNPVEEENHFGRSFEIELHGPCKEVNICDDFFVEHRKLDSCLAFRIRCTVLPLQTVNT